MDLHFDKASVDKITQGLRSAISELGEIGSGTGSVMGKGFSDLAITGMEAGDHGLSVDFEDFCERWDWGVRSLIHDASEIAKRLGLAAGTQWAEDQYVQGSLKVIASSFAGGSPYASEEDIEKQSWGDVFTPDSLHPDYSADSWKKAGHEMAQTWKDTGRSLLTEGQGGVMSGIGNQIAGVDDQEFNRDLDRVFGPSPEERAAQQDQQPEQGQGQGQDGGK
ncbi:hypothetical protein [Streptomyces sp. TS71-3]|uniref:hypothetical protein n=1 Tax=Streptomyces sp. TS71-3 TaxID=2733862 RepID=UPI001BB33E83|nr:hypothetical protein [Streptomyces sp. TS71-3]